MRTVHCACAVRTNAHCVYHPLWRNAFIYMTWLIDRWRDAFMRDIRHSYVGHDSFVYVTWLIHMFDKDSFICDMTLLYVTWLIRVWYKAFIRMTWLIRVCDMTHWCMWQDSSICATRLILYVTGLIYMWHDAFMCDMSRSCAWPDSSAHCHNVLWHIWHCDNIYGWVIPPYI